MYTHTVVIFSVIHTQFIRSLFCLYITVTLKEIILFLDLNYRASSLLAYINAVIQFTLIAGVYLLLLCLYYWHGVKAYILPLTEHLCMLYHSAPLSSVVSYVSVIRTVRYRPWNNIQPRRKCYSYVTYLDVSITSRSKVYNDKNWQ